MGAQILQSSSHLKILDARKVTWNQFQNEVPLMFSANVQNLDTAVTWDPRFLNPCFITFYNIPDFIVTDCWNPNKLLCWRITPY